MGQFERCYGRSDFNRTLKKDRSRLSGRRGDRESTSRSIPAIAPDTTSSAELQLTLVVSAPVHS
jgi:hypothetical protein